ncbi:6-bladed beta-propeller [Parabacteroides sp. OttesenSCG-928-G07]|nr:6-bladed beta-propeller [Parabacteroides sp. OttesenSCG-928-G07]
MVLLGRSDSYEYANNRTLQCLNRTDKCQSVSDVYNYDKDNLIGYDMSDYPNKGADRNKSYHVLLSKSDGRITREIFIPFKTINTPVTKEGVVGYFDQIRPAHGKWTLMETSSDTLYSYSSDGRLTPFIVRTPSAHTMEPEIFLYMGIYTNRYYFMRTVKNVFDLEKGNGFYDEQLMYDKEENALFRISVYNDDYVEKRTVAVTARSLNHEIEDVTSLSASRLVEEYKKNNLKGKLKEIAAGLDEDDNPVIMLKKHKR